MRIAFIIPDKEWVWDTIHQGIGYVASYAVKNFPVTECQVFRTHGREEKDLVDFLEQGWDVVGFSVTHTAIGEVQHISERVKSTGPAKIVVGGAEVTALKERVFNSLPLTDFAVSGEGEITFCELLECLKSSGDFSKIQGLLFKDDAGNVVKNEGRAFEQDLEKFPYPDRSLFQYDYAMHSIIGTRGCPFHCTFCNSAANWGHRYRLRQPKTVAQEVRYVQKLFNDGKQFAFNDDSFNLNKKWVLELCRELKGLNVSWWIRGLRAGLVTEEIADALAESGCTGAACGVESANNDALKAMRKATKIEEILLGVKLLRERGLSINGQFIIGNQGDTLETVRESIDCAKNFTDSTFGIAYPVPNTFLHDYVQKNNYLLKDPVPVKYKGEIIDWILFDTPHFPVSQRLEAIDLAIQAKVYHNIQYVEGEVPPAVEKEGVVKSDASDRGDGVIAKIMSTCQSKLKTLFNR